MYVETYPASPEDIETYHKWYNETHVPEMVSVEGFVSARRFEPVGHDGPFIAIYEIEADKIEDAQANLAASSGRSAPQGVQLDPPAVVRYYREIADYQP
jgi:hypothetical protein